MVHLVRRALIAAALLALGLAQPGHAAEPPKLDLVMRPYATGGPDSYLGVRMTLAAPGLKAGEGLVHLPLKLVGIPTARYDGDALTAKDASGPLPLVQAEEPPTPQGVYRRWSVTRATVGDVVVSYRAPPRQITAATNNGPLFDLREEAGGFAGAGVGFVATPVSPGPYRVHLTWDLSAAPAGSRGVWSLGEGEVNTVAPAELLAFSYYAVGPLKSYPAKDTDKFAFYWLGEPTFDAPALGQRIQQLYGALAKFFGDTQSSYHVFVRQNPYKGTGGTALAHSFMFGYEPAARPTPESLQGLLSHEMTHTWPAMQGEHGDTAWYSEGTAEYYSMLLSHRAGVLPPDRLLSALNDKALAYYSNPYRSLSNPEAAQRFWTDPIAQTVPYGRGVFYLANTDAEIRAASHGARSLDGVVLELHRRAKAGEPYGIAQWLELVGREIGADKANARYEAMAFGGLIHLPADRFAPCFKVVRQDVRPFQLGFAHASLNDDRVVRDLEPGSAAEQAGLRNGDVIVSAGDINAVRNDETKPLSLTLRRADTQLTVSYLPRGAPAEAYRWVRDPKEPDTSCKF